MWSHWSKLSSNHWSDSLANVGRSWNMMSTELAPDSLVQRPGMTNFGQFDGMLCIQANGQISDQDSHPPPPQANQQTFMHPPPPPNRPGQFINNPDRRGFFDNNSMTESGSKRSLSASPPPPPPLHPPRKELPFSPASEEDAKHFFDHRKQRQRGQYERIHASDSRLRSKSASDSSSDMFFMERRKSSNRPRKVPRNFKFKGSIDVQTMSRDFRKVPCERLCWSEGTMRPPIHPPMPPCIRFPPQPPPPPSSIGLMNCSAPFFDRGASCGEGSRFCAGSSNQFAPPPPQVLLQPPAPLNSSSAHQLSPLPQSPPHHQQQYHPAYRPGKSGYPPIPPGAKIVAQYVTEMSDEQRIAGQSTREPPFRPMPYSNVHPSFPIGINNNPMYRGTETPMIFPLPQQQIRFPNMGRTSCIPPPCETIVETCVPSKKTIDIYEKKKKRCARPDYTLEFDKLRDDIINSLTTEFRKLDFRREPLAVDKEVKVIVQPIQPVFYVPQKSTGGGDGGGSSSTQQPVAPTVIYVPRNVYVPVIKPVFVPRERVIVRPQIVHVARPVVIDRPVPVCQRPIVIDRERPTPYPVRVPVAHHTSHEHFSSSAAVEGTVNEQYVFADNVPNAYGGRTGEFAYGLNYGYEPKDDRYRYIISGCDYSGPVHTEILNGAESVSQQQQQRNIDDDDETLHHLHHHHLLLHQQHQQHNRADLHQLDHQHLQHTHHHRTQPNVDQPAPPNRFDAAVDAELFNGESEQNSSSSDGTSHSSTSNSSSNKPRFEILDPSLKSSWQPIDQDILIQRYGQTAKEITEISERFGNKSDPNHGICRCPNSSDGLPISNSTDYHTKRPIIRDEILKKADKQTAHNVLIYRDFSIRA